MIKVLIDTNILIDVMVPARENHEPSYNFVKACIDGKLQGSVSAGSLKDAYYIVCKHAPEKRVRSLIRWFLDHLEVQSVDYGICHEALESNEPDFEDGIVRAIAEVSGCDYVVTHDESAFARSTVKSIPAWMALELL